MLRYENANDSGYALSSSIQPVSNGEQANETVFRRPSENLRVRTDAIRTFLDKRTLLEQIYHHLVLLPEDPAQTRIHFTGTKFYLNTDGSSGNSTRGLKLTAFFKDNVFYPMAEVTFGNIGNEASFLVKSQRSAAAGGNNIKFKIVVSGSGSGVTITTTPETNPDPEKGPVLITATCGSSATLADLQTALSTNSFIRIPYVSNGSASCPTLSEFYIATTTLLGLPPAPNIVSCGSAGRTTIYITAEKLNEFFASNTLAANDIVVVQFSTVNALLTCNESTAVSLEKISASANPNNGEMPVLSSGICDDLLIPIATVVGSGDDAILVFRDGRIFGKVRTPFTKGPFFSNVCKDTQLAAAAKSDTYGLFPLSEGTTASQLEALQNYLAGHIDTTDKTKPHSLSKIKDKPFVTVGVNGDYGTVSDAISALLSTGGTIFLLSDRTENVSVNVGGFTKQIVILGNSKTLTFSGSGDWLIQTTISSGSFYFYNVRFVTTGTWTVASTSSNVFLENCAFDGAFVFLTPSLSANGCIFSRTNDVPLIYEDLIYLAAVTFKLYLNNCTLSGTRLFSISATSGGFFDMSLENTTIQYSATNPLVATNIDVRIVCKNCNIQAASSKFCVLSGTLNDFILQNCSVAASVLVDTTGTCQRISLQHCALDVHGNWFKAPSGTKNEDTNLIIEDCYSGAWSTFIFNELPVRNVKLSRLYLAGEGQLIFDTNGGNCRIFIDDSIFITTADDEGTAAFDLRLGDYNLFVKGCFFKLHRTRLLYKGPDANVYLNFSNNVVEFSFDSATIALFDSLYSAKFCGNRFLQTGTVYSTVTLFSGGSVYENNTFTLKGNTGLTTPLIAATDFINNTVSVTATQTTLAVRTNVFIGNNLSGTEDKVVGVTPLGGNFVCVGNNFSNLFRGIYADITTDFLGLRVSNNRFTLVNSSSTPPVGIALVITGATVALTLTGNYFRRSADTSGQAFGIVTSLQNSAKLYVAGYGNIFSRFVQTSGNDVWSGIAGGAGGEVICYSLFGGSDTHPYLQPSPTNKDKFFAHQIISVD